MWPSSPSRLPAPSTPGAAEPWITLNLALDRRRSAPESADAAFARLNPALRRWRRQGAVTAAWFVRKPPDVRLRLAVPDLDVVKPELASLLDGLVRDGTLTTWFPSPYEPETVQLGGEAATALAHAWFDADTRAWSVRRRGSRVSDEALTLLVLTDLFRRVCPDRGECWDAWCNLARVHEGRGWTGALRAPAEPIDGATFAERDLAVLRHYQRANQAYADGMDAVWQRGELLYGVRTVLPFVALFHWNRLGLSTASRQRVYRRRIAADDPRAGMIGGAP
jgi:thiopeptide-type bacteriocin biosynthesis protein